MKVSGKTEAALKWAKTWPELDGFLKLNAILAKDEEASFNTAYTTSSGEPYIDGTAKHEFIFMLKMMLPWSDGYDSVNEEANALMEQWRDWVDEQYPDNVPDFDAEILDISALYDVPAMTVYSDDSLAEYNFQAKITYIEQEQS